jgi:N-carbamoyl-L-amino-acid hydrolase
MERHARALAESIAVERRVRFDLGAFDLSPPAAMEPGLQALLSEGSRELGIACGTLPSGAGHDAQDFAHAGFPAGMVFVRNANGSHNPEEAMDIADFNLGMQVLAWALTR